MSTFDPRTVRSTRAAFATLTALALVTAAGCSSAPDAEPTAIAAPGALTGSGPTTPGVVRSSTFILRNSNTTGAGETRFTYGNVGDVPLVGDWDHDGVQTPGVFRNGTFYLRNSNSWGYADITFNFGAAGDIPVVGDWDGDGTQTIGVFHQGVWFLRNSNSAGAADIVIQYGLPTDVPIVGDWDGNGTDTVGVVRGGNNWILRNENTQGNGEIRFVYGNPGDVPVVGDWDGNGTFTPGVYRGGNWFLRNSNTTGVADVTFNYGLATDIPRPGRWKTSPKLLSFNISTADFDDMLKKKLDGIVIQIAQDGKGKDSDVITENLCHYDPNGGAACRKACIDGGGVEPGDVANCLKGCSSNNFSCSPVNCQASAEPSFIHFPDGLTGSTKACDPADCVPCNGDTEPALFDRPIVLPNPLVSQLVGLINYHCTLNHVRFTLAKQSPVFIFPNYIQILLSGTTVSPAISCDNGAPDLDLRNPEIVVHFVPSVADGHIVANVTGSFAAGVTSHNSAAEFIALAEDAQGLVTRHGSAAVNAEVSKLSGQLGKSLDDMVHQALPTAKIDHVTYDLAAGVTVFFSL